MLKTYTRYIPTYQAIFSTQQESVVLEDLKSVGHSLGKYSALVLAYFSEANTLEGYLAKIFQQKRFRQRVRSYLNLIRAWRELRETSGFEWRPEKLVQDCLDSLSAKKLIIKEDAIRSHFENEVKDTAFNAVSALATEKRLSVFHSDRPDEISYFLSSLNKQLRIENTQALVYIFDDSRVDDNKIKLHQHVEQAIEGGLPARVIVFDREARRKFCELLDRQNVLSYSDALFAFGLENPHLNSCGGQRNFSLLLNAGHVFTSADSDIQFRFYAHKAYQSLYPTQIDRSADTFVHLELHPEERTLQDKIIEIQDNFFAKQSCFNESLPTLLKKEFLDNKLTLNYFGPKITKQYFSEKSRIKLKLWGLVGDSGSNERTAHLFMSPKILSKFFGVQERYNKISRSRQVIKFYPGDLITRSFRIMSTALALDNRELSPYFYPYYRSSDMGFGAFLYNYHKDSYVHYDQTMLYHNPLLHRVRAQVQVEPFCFLEPVKLISHLASKTTSYEDFGHHLEHLLNKSYETFADELSWIHKNDLYQQVRNLDTLVNKSSGYPQTWRHEAEQSLSRLLEQIRRPFQMSHSELWNSFMGDCSRSTEQSNKDLHKLTVLSKKWETLFNFCANNTHIFETLGEEYVSLALSKDLSHQVYVQPSNDIS